MKIIYHDGVSEIATNLALMSRVLDKNKIIFINGNIARTRDIKRLIGDIKKGTSIATKETDTYIEVFA